MQKVKVYHRSNVYYGIVDMFKYMYKVVSMVNIGDEQILVVFEKN